ncbi:IS21 family transposase [Desulfoscipio gibsoniae]|uniref:Transposase n=1 Tax=Desulfoscipio gibsoniae DSM 7213 TaxID=767817 RepID=R4KCS8_9FIRM|nr:IS21 family transposase [Desulfoscipio gibsoniae]AGL00978.1 transposase [Desulfoscipio gibsoniae DSM 7213]
MKTEEGWGMYIDIHRLKQQGFSKTKIAKMLGISRPTVIKYLKMSAKEFEKEMLSKRQRTKKPDIYREKIITWIQQNPDMTAAQIFDWLEERYQKIAFNEATLRNYVRSIREEYDIPKVPVRRQYEAVEDPPPGKQMQVDFGEKKVINTEGNIVTLYVMCFVLSHSRYKYCQWQGRPFNTKDIIEIHENAFDYFGGYPQEAVYDQDHLILVSENHGELIYTREFASYLQKRKFSVYMCRKADPESKGRVEKVVDFVKNNFASHRVFHGIDRWNEDCIKWLKRRGNGKVHATTRKIPAEVFFKEKKYLQLVTEKINSKSRTLSITYQVRKDNTVPIQGNRYTVPRGTYKGPNTYVGVTKIGNKHLIIFDLETEKELAKFEIPDTKGNLVRNNNHSRDKSQKINTLMKKVAEKFLDSQKAQAFLEEIHKEKPRYIRDQLKLIEASLESADRIAIDKALDFCVSYRLNSAVDFRDAVKHYAILTQEKNTSQPPITGLTETASVKIGIKPRIRDISEYVKIMSENHGG